jgi:hypothetical protein
MKEFAVARRAVAADRRALSGYRPTWTAGGGCPYMVRGNDRKLSVHSDSISTRPSHPCLPLKPKPGLSEPPAARATNNKERVLSPPVAEKSMQISSRLTAEDFSLTMPLLLRAVVPLSTSSLLLRSLPACSAGALHFLVKNGISVDQCPGCFVSCLIPSGCSQFGSCAGLG